VVGSETVLIRDASGTKLRRLDSFFESSDDCSRRTVLSPEGLEVLAASAPRWTPEFLPVSAITRRAFEGEICEIRTKMGRRLRCTPDHPFVVLDQHGARARVAQAGELSTEDWLPLAVGEPANAEPTDGEFDLIELLPELGIQPEEVLARVGVEAVRDPAVAERLRRVLPTARIHEIGRSGTLRLNEARAADLDLRTATLGTAKNGTYVPSRISASPQFWRMIGLYVAEGWVTSDFGRNGAERMRIGWSFHPNAEPHLVAEIVEFFAALGVHTSTYARPTTQVVSLSSRILARFLLRSLGVGADCYSHRIPDALWRASLDSKRAFLSGVWDGDGSWSFVANRRGIVWEFGTVSRELADGMLRLLAELSIVARWRIGRSAKSTTDAHFLTISGAEQVERVLEFAPERDWPAISRALGRQTKRIASTGWRDEPARVRVASLERRPFSGHVYSLEVPGAETFAVTGNLVVHNCFPKDVRALLHTARAAGSELGIVDAAERANERQKRVLGARVRQHFGGSLTGKRIAVWGLAFKPETDDIREAPALVLIEELLEAGANVSAFDPVAMDNVRQKLGDRIEYAHDMYAAAEGADALVLVTEWHVFRRPDFERLVKSMRAPVLFDGRNIYSPDEMRALGFDYSGIGRPKR
jgi:UDPglucose 6-dehydrogenase